MVGVIGGWVVTYLDQTIRFITYSLHDYIGLHDTIMLL